MFAAFTGAMQQRRALLLAHSQLVAVAFFGGATAEQLQEFVRCGELDLSKRVGPDDMPYDKEALKQAVRNAKGGLGVLRE